MSDNKSGEGKGSLFSDAQETAPRARNRTVMLTPDIATQVRARLSRKVAADEENPAQASFFSAVDQPKKESADSISLPYEEFVAKANQSSEAEEFEQVESEEFSDFENSSIDGIIESYEVSDFQEPEEFSPISRQVHKLEVGSADHAESSEPQNRYETAPEAPQDSFITKRSVFVTPVQIQESAKPEIRVEAIASVETHKPFADIVQQQVKQEENTMSSSFEIYWSKVTPIVGFFVSFDKDPAGEVLVLRSGRLLISSEVPTSGSYAYIQDETVSPMHAILRITEDSQVQLLDNLSEYGTSIVRTETAEEISLSGEKAMLFHGDLVKFGSRCFTLCLIKGV